MCACLAIFNLIWSSSLSPLGGPLHRLPYSYPCPSVHSAHSCQSVIFREHRWTVSHPAWDLHWMLTNPGHDFSGPPLTSLRFSVSSLFLAAECTILLLSRDVGTSNSLCSDCFSPELSGWLPLSIWGSAHIFIPSEGPSLTL